ncbi:Hsp20/alpha crystallin family protein [Nisaea nitritireducens]|uniref:Hsp20/alpha crystallin family protein n=1 Tax=Nisaea nitritireducens TaxID=568392 RepID=UPI00186948C5|nr:Hsp20/alpha crystallin family protein [Nisaea nitritireducens]
MGNITESKSSEPAKTYADPFSAFRAEMDRMFHNFLQSPAMSMSLPFTGMHGGLVVPTTDMKESDTQISITTELPGMGEDDVEVTVKSGTLTVKGEKTEEKRDEKDNYHLTERRYGQFQRSFKLPENIDEAKIKASFDKGVLTITMPKSKDGTHAERRIKIGA